MRGINAAVNPCRLEVDPLLGTNASAIGMLGLGHLGDGVGIVDQFGLRIAPGQYHSRIAPAFKGIDDGLGKRFSDSSSVAQSDAFVIILLAKRVLVAQVPDRLQAFGHTASIEQHLQAWA